MRRKTLSLLIALFCVHAAHAALFNITILQPKYLTDSTIAISANVTSTYDLYSITASIGAAQSNLMAGSPFYAVLYQPGGFDINDSLTVVIIATDVLSNKDTTTLTFLLKKPVIPFTLAVDSPLTSTVARPMVHIRATFSNILGNPSQYQITGQPYPNEFAFTIDTGRFFGADTVIDKMYDLSAYQGMTVGITFMGKDLLTDTTVTKTKTVFVDASPALEEVYTSSGENYLVDFNFNRLVYVKPDTTIQTVSLEDNSIKNGHAGYRYFSPFNGFSYFPIAIGSALSTREGAIFKATFPDDPTGSKPGLYDMNGDSTYTLIGSTVELNNGEFNVAVAGDYAGYGTYAQPFGFRLRNLVTLHDSLINTVPASGYPTGGEPFENGSAIYSNGVDIYKYDASGITTQLTNNSSGMTGGYYPSSDGKMTAFQGFNNGVYITNGIVDTLLSPTNFGNDYIVKNGYVVYPENGAVYHQETLWIKDSTGASHQASIFSTDSHPDVLGDSGKLIYHIDIRSDPSSRFPDYSIRQYVTNSLVTRALCTELGKAYYYNGDFYVGIGRSLFKLNTAIGGDTVTAITKEVKKDSVYTFTSTDFSNAFKGPGSLITVKITATPAHGNLALNQNAVSANTTIARTAIGGLTYTPEPGFIGADTIRWNGSSGVEYAPHDTLIVLNSVVSLPVTLLNFTVAAADNLNLLNWQTTKEINTAYFTVERGRDGQNFLPIGTVNALGNSSIIQSYQYSDLQPLQGTSYYRLKMVDIDGHFTYSIIKSISRKDILLAASLYPNPAHHTVSLQISSDRQQDILIQVIDIAGNVLTTTPFAAINGTTTKDIAINGLANGIYTIRITGTNIHTILKLVKQ